MSFDSPFDSQSALLVEVHHDNDTATVRMVIAGDVDADTSARVRKPFTEALRRHRPDRIDVDVRGITFLDSGGIWTLISCKAEAERTDCHLSLLNVPDKVHRVLQITGLLEHFGLGPPRPDDAAHRPDVTRRAS